MSRSRIQYLTLSLAAVFGWALAPPPARAEMMLPDLFPLADEARKAGASNGRCRLTSLAAVASRVPRCRRRSG